MERPISTHAFHAADLLRFARFLADLLDQRFTIPGTSIRIGLDPIVSLIPGIGDAANTILGAVPIFGDIVSIWFRSNVKNVELLERYAGRESRRAALGDWVFVIVLIFGLFVLLAGIVLAVAWLLKQVWNIL